MIHTRTHPVYVEGCFMCRVSSVGIAASATGSVRAQTGNELEHAWDRDMHAYKRLRDNGVQPPRIDGSARREATANTRADIESI